MSTKYTSELTKFATQTSSVGYCTAKYIALCFTRRQTTYSFLFLTDSSKTNIMPTCMIETVFFLARNRFRMTSQFKSIAAHIFCPYCFWLCVTNCIRHSARPRSANPTFWTVRNSTKVSTENRSVNHLSLVLDSLGPLTAEGFRKILYGFSSLLITLHKCCLYSKQQDEF